MCPVVFGWSVTSLSCWLRVQKHDLALGRVLAQALAVHPSASGLWVLAARTQMEQSRDIAAARYVACMAAVPRVPQTYSAVRSGRSLLQRGIRSNPHSHHLWHEAFRLELLHVDKVQRRQEVLGLEGEVCVVFVDMQPACNGVSVFSLATGNSFIV